MADGRQHDRNANERMRLVAQIDAPQLLNQRHDRTSAADHDVPDPIEERAGFLVAVRRALRWMGGNTDECPESF